jgi:sporulation protein YunB
MRVRCRRTARPKILLALVLAITALLIFNWQIKPVMESETENAAKVRAVSIINSTVLDEISKNPVRYENLVHITRDSENGVLSLTSDVMKMNEFKSKIVLAVQKELQDHEDSSVNIPIGTLIGSHLFHGRGPGLNLKITLAGNVKADFKSLFESAGINQTRHRIYLTVATSVYSFLPGVESTTDVSTDVLVAETVIVGDVPQVVVDSKRS